LPSTETRHIAPLGFTLIELVAALALSGLALLGAARLLDQLADSRDRSAHATVASDDRMNGMRLLRALAYRGEASSDTSHQFAGDDGSTAFSSWCEVSGGWLERCSVSLRLIVHRDSSSLVASIPTAQPIVLWRGAGAAELRYFSGAGAGGRWWRGWGTSLALPRAIGIVTARDTVVLSVGAGT
jgi:prepilin-type N-terminal cleavage/methylation domain-containing protein